jgi:hypothetical protein
VYRQFRMRLLRKAPVSMRVRNFVAVVPAAGGGAAAETPLQRTTA